MWHSPGSCFYLQPSPYIHIPWGPFVRKSKSRKQMSKGDVRRMSMRAHAHVCFARGLLYHSPGSFWGKSCAQSQHHQPLQQALASLVCFPDLIPLFLPRARQLSHNTEARQISLSHRVEKVTLWMCLPNNQ